MESIALILFGCAALAGVLAGLVATRRAPAAPGLRTSFLIYLGLLSVAASTLAQSMAIVPLTVIYGTVAGVLPFAAGYHGVRWVVRSLGRRHAARSGSATPADRPPCP